VDVGQARSRRPSRPVSCAVARSSRPPAPACHSGSRGRAHSAFPPRAPCPSAQAEGGATAIDLADADGEVEARTERGLDLAPCAIRGTAAVVLQHWHSTTVDIMVPTS